MMMRLLLLAVISQCALSAPAHDDSLKEALKSLNLEQVRELAELLYDQKVQDEAERSNESNESDDDSSDDSDVYMVTEAPVAREELPEAIAAELGVVKEMRELADKMESNRDRLDELIGRLEGGGSKRGLLSNTANEEAFMRREQRLLNDISNKIDSRDQKAAMLDRMSRLIEEERESEVEHKRSRRAVNNQAEMVTMGFEPILKRRKRQAVFEDNSDFEMTTAAMPERRRRDLAAFDDMHMEENVEQRAEGLVNRLEDLLGALRKIE